MLGVGVFMSLIGVFVFLRLEKDIDDNWQLVHRSIQAHFDSYHTLSTRREVEQRTSSLCSVLQSSYGPSYKPNGGEIIMCRKLQRPLIGT